MTTSEEIARINAGLPFLVPHYAAQLALTFLNGALTALEHTERATEAERRQFKRQILASRQVALDVVNQHGNDKGQPKKRGRKPKGVAA